MGHYNIKRVLKVSLWALLLLLIIGIFCYVNISPVDAIAGASPATVGLQEDGALSHLINGESR